MAQVNLKHPFSEILNSFSAVLSNTFLQLTSKQDLQQKPSGHNLTLGGIYDLHSLPCSIMIRSNCDGVILDY